MVGNIFCAMIKVLVNYTTSVSYYLQRFDIKFDIRYEWEMSSR